ncbi:MAG: phosphoglycerate dehydrogenase [Dehalococcoidia bacterium]
MEQAKKVLVSDKLGETGLKLLEEEEELDVDIKTGLTPDELKAIIGEYDALVVRSATRVSADILDAATRLKVIGRAGIGVDNIDVPAATKHGIVVMNTPGGNVVTTAEHAIALMMALTRNIPQGTASLKAMQWDKKKLQGREMFNKTLGVIGYGKIGSVVALRGRGLKMRVVVHDPVVNSEKIEKKGFKSVTMEELLQISDYITIHVPKNKRTTGLLNKAAFDQMKDEVMIINCARGGIVNEADLCDALASGKVAGAALDVFETEPPGDCPLLKFDNVIATPHLGASTKEAQSKVAVAVAKQIIAFLKNNTITNSVNVPSVTGEALVKLRPFLTMANKMGALLAQLVDGQLKQVEIEYNGDFHDMDMDPVTTALIKGLLDPLISDEVNLVNAPSIAQEMGIRITQAESHESVDYTNLMTATVNTSKMATTVAGTVFGKNSPRIVRINEVRLEMIPEGYFTLIHEQNVPGAIGDIGALLGANAINIDRMTTGDSIEHENSVVFLRTEAPLSPDVVEKMRALPAIKAVTPLEL